MTVVVIASVCLGLLYAAGASALRDRKRRAHPVTRIADCKDGTQVKLVGQVVAIETFTAPKSGRACVGYSVLATDGIEASVHDALHSFLVDDGSARAIVDCGPAGQPIELDLHPGVAGQRIFKRFTPARWRRDSFAGAELLSESLLLDGAYVAVFGEVQLLAEAGITGQSGYRDGSISRVKLVPPRDGEFLVTTTAYYFRGGRPRAPSP